MLDIPVTRRSFLAGTAAVVLAVAKPHRPRKPLPTVPTFQLKQSSLRGGAYLRGGA